MDNGFISISIYVRCWDPENFPWGFGLQWGFGLGGGGTSFEIWSPD